MTCELASFSHHVDFGSGPTLTTLSDSVLPGREDISGGGDLDDDDTLFVVGPTAVPVPGVPGLLGLAPASPGLARCRRQHARNGGTAAECNPRALPACREARVVSGIFTCAGRPHPGGARNPLNPRRKIGLVRIVLGHRPRPADSRPFRD